MDTVNPDNLVSKVASLTAIVEVSADNQAKDNESFIKRLDDHGVTQKQHSERLSKIEGETGATREMVTTLLNRPRNGAKRNIKQDAMLMGGGGVGIAGIIEAVQRFLG